MGGSASEFVLGEEKGRAFNRRMQSYGTHWGEQTGVLKEGVDKFAGDTMDFFERNTRSLRPQDSGNNKQEAQTASANYTGQAQTQRSGSGKRGSGKLTSDNKKSGKGKRALTIQK